MNALHSTLIAVRAQHGPVCDFSPEVICSPLMAFAPMKRNATRTCWASVLAAVVCAVLAPPPAIASDLWCKTASGTIVVRSWAAGCTRWSCRVGCSPDETPVHSGMVQQALQCPPDAVKVGPTCVDTYEASIWTIPADKPALIGKVQLGEAAGADLTGGGATDFGRPPFPPFFPETGNWTGLVFAASVPGVLPTVGVTWFQAEQACALSGKHLLTNQEWQRAAAGTPDPGNADDWSTTCATNSTLALTGARTNCVSVWGAHDMVGNAREWVADWVDLNDGPKCTNWPSAFGDDVSCVGGPGGVGRLSLPAAFQRGGSYYDHDGAGVFAILADFTPDRGTDGVGFRCAR